MRWSSRPGAGYEVSSKGDRRFSALYARLPDGRILEDAWGQAKGYRDGRSAKGKPALTPDFDYWGTYKGLWQQWADANPQLMDELAAASKGQVLVDRFAKTENNQARALAEILAERAGSAEQPSKPMRLVIAGGREFDDYALLKSAVAEALGEHPLNQLEVVSGAARGADRLGERWARENGVALRQFPADWNQHGKRAGYLRNEEMADYADAVLVLPGGRGTDHMAQSARRRGLKLFDYRGRLPGGLIGELEGTPMPEQPAAVARPTGQQAPDAVQLKMDLESQQVQTGPQRKAGDLLPWLLAAGAGGLLGYGVSELAKSEQEGW